MRFSSGAVVEAEVHRLVQRSGATPQLRHRVLDDPQAHGQPAVVHRGQDRRQWRAGRRPRGELRARAVVVPVVELAARVLRAFQALDGRQRALEPTLELALADEAEPLGHDGAPHVGADVRRRGLHAARAVGVEDVGRQPRPLIGHRLERRPRLRGVLLELTVTAPMPAAGGSGLPRRDQHERRDERGHTSASHELPLRVGRSPKYPDPG